MSPVALTPAEAAAFVAPLVAAGLPADVVRGCERHFALLRHWNETHNLTRITDPAEAAVRHYLDCALPVFSGPVPEATPARVFADIGSGAGFPGLVASLVRPDFAVVLVEPARKRASFLRVAGGDLALGRRLQVVAPAPRGAPSTGAFPWVLSRATFSKGVRDELWPYVAAGGVLWAWTTPAEQNTWSDLVGTWPDAVLTWHAYGLPGVGERLIAMIARTNADGRTPQPSGR
jgi:16S rRNA (guanine(527)-N(7))-methyltransferase RsmG